MADNNTIRPSSGSLFWLGAFSISVVGLILLGIWAFFNNSVQASIIAFVFASMLFASGILSREDLFKKTSFRKSATAFTVGFIAWAIVGASNSGTLSLLSVAQNSLFATISSELPEFIEFIFNVFVIPIAEESLWIIAIPDVMKALLGGLAQNRALRFLDNKVLQLVLTAAVAGITFALFHLGNLGVASFILAAIIFRVVMIFLVTGDSALDVIKGADVVPAFAVGAHVGHNWGQFGLTRGWNLLLQNFGTTWFIILIFVIIAITAADTIIGWIRRGFSSESAS